MVDTLWQGLLIQWRPTRILIRKRGPPSPQVPSSLLLQLQNHVLLHQKAVLVAREETKVNEVRFLRAPWGGM